MKDFMYVFLVICSILSFLILAFFLYNFVVVLTIL